LLVVGNPPTADTDRGLISFMDNRAYNTATLGAKVMMGGAYNTAGAMTFFAGLAGLKENTTDGNYAGALAFYTRANGAASSEKMRITSGGELVMGSGGQIQTTGGYYRLRTSASATVGLFIQRSTWTGSGDASPSIAAETGYGIPFFTNGTTTPRMEITSGGAVQISAPTSGQALTVTGRSNAWTAEVVGSSTTGQSYGLRVRAGTNASDVAVLVTSSANTPDLFSIRGDGYIITGLASVSPYNNTTAAAANMHVADNGSLARSTSSLKYKTDVLNYCKGLSEVMQLRPVSYKGKNDGDKVFAGLIAEEVHELGLTEFVQYAQDGTPDALAYQNMVALLTKAIQEQQQQIEQLKAKLN
jgi:hypothetical protein